ncbi:MAG: hypothetical protein ACXWUG_29130 [Polyangiales bacterium]
MRASENIGEVMTREFREEGNLAKLEIQIERRGDPHVTPTFLHRVVRQTPRRSGVIPPAHELTRTLRPSNADDLVD